MHLDEINFLFGGEKKSSNLWLVKNETSPFKNVPFLARKLPEL
jgi:hypothetical protein